MCLLSPHSLSADPEEKFDTISTKGKLFCFATLMSTSSMHHMHEFCLDVFFNLNLRKQVPAPLVVHTHGEYRKNHGSLKKESRKQDEKQQK